ncbi:ABC transporter permease [uncultured Fretibacterium sp.]|uniref:ABC transporter permease n=1 Tax=uncultured Fretibacterium sp. TaxID=1678694 RepID=UPI0026239C0D|nr:ABC transporter permease [uncultured Fretibacterium sp.]
MMDNSTNAGFDLIIEPNRTTGAFFRELLRYRELFYFLAWRDILVRYKQTVIGIAWSVIRPLLTMLVFTVVFGRLARLPNEGVPYPILVFSAMLPWQYFSNAMQESSNSLIAESRLISKVYFPRLIVPASSVIVSAVDFLISLALLGLLMLGYSFVPSWTFLFMPFFFLLATLAALGAGFWLSALNVKYRDFRYIVPFLVQFGLYVSPVGFSSSVVPERWRLLYSLNPMVGVIDGFRWCVQGTASSLYLPGFLISAAISVLSFFSGVWFFRRTERFFADFI